MFTDKLVKDFQFGGCLGRRQLFKIALLEKGPVAIAVKPFAQSVRGSKVPEPVVYSSLLFFDSARPQTVYQHPLPVRKRRFLISAFECNRHLHTNEGSSLPLTPARAIPARAGDPGCRDELC